MSLVSDKPHLIRQYDIIPEKTLSTPVTVVGAGAIGSWVVLLLAKMGMTDITVYDHDKVAIENVNCQLYGREDVGVPKVFALTKIVQKLSAKIGLRVATEKWSPDPATKGIVICAVDSMEVRKQVFEEICKSHIFVEWFIDCRMGAEEALMYTVRPHNPKDAATYRKTLYTDADAVQAPCTAKATGYTAALISGWCVRSVKAILTKEAPPRITLWSIKNMDMKVYREDVPVRSEG